jgi:hypothetical protein
MRALRHLHPECEGRGGVIRDERDRKLELARQQREQQGYNHLQERSKSTLSFITLERAVGLRIDQPTDCHRGLACPGRLTKMVKPSLRPIPCLPYIFESQLVDQLLFLG